jgi:hypothetical protein
VIVSSASTSSSCGEGVQMDRDEKRRLRDRIGEHLDVSRTRLTDDETTFLGEFIDTYDETYKGRADTRTTSHNGWSSDGKFTRRETFTDTFTDDVAIRQEYEYHDDDGQSGASASEIRDARGILNWFRDHG